MGFSVYAYETYKELIKQRVRQLKKQNSRVSLAWLAEKIGIQYTYLSKVLNQEGSHLSADHFFECCQFLDFSESETEFAEFLRHRDVTINALQKDRLTKKIETLRLKQNLSGEYVGDRGVVLNEEIQYFMDPLNSIVRMALRIEKHKKNPRGLCSLMGITPEKLKSILQILRKNNFIEVGKDIFTIENVIQRKTTLSREHPLMRVYQTLFKTQLSSRVQETQEEDKESFTVTFNGSQESFENIRKEYKEFLLKVQQISTESRSEHVFQMSIDLVKWM